MAGLATRRATSRWNIAWRKTAWAWTLGTVLATTLLVAPASLAQTVTISNCANPLPNPPFGNTGCRLGELADDNGGTITIQPSIKPPVKIVFTFDKDSFKAESRGVTDTDPANITVFPIAVSSNRPGLQFTDVADQWKVQGGPAPNFQLNSKNDVIEYRVEAQDPTTGQSINRITDVEVSLRAGAVTSTNADAPAQARIRDVISDDAGTNIFGSGVGLEVFKSTDLTRGKDGERLTLTRTFDKRSVIRVRKEVKPEPGSDPTSVAEIEHVRQHVSLEADKEVGCAPGTRTTPDGDETVLEFCALPENDAPLPFAGPFAQDNGAFNTGTVDFTTGEDRKWHSLVPADGGAKRVDHIVNLDPVLPTVDPGTGNFIFPNGFDTNNNGTLTIDVGEFDSGFQLIDQRIVAKNLNTNQSADIARLGDVETIGAESFTIEGFFGGQVTDSGKAVLNVDALPSGGLFPEPGILTKDTSQIFNGGGAPVIDIILPGDPFETDQGTVTLGPNFVETAAVDNKTGDIVIRNLGFGSPPEERLIFAPHTGPGRVAAISGAAVPSGNEIFIFGPRGDLNGRGDFASTAFTTAPGGAFPTGRAALVFPLEGNQLTVFENGDPVQGIADALVEGTEVIGINDSRRGVVDLTFLDAAGLFNFAVLGFSFDGTTVTLDPQPLISTLDTVTGPDGIPRQPVFFEFDPRGVGPNRVVINAIFFDDTRALLNIPLNPSAATVPDIIGFDQGSAEAAIVAANFVVGFVTAEPSDTVPAGEVISQFPTAGEEVAAGSAVDLVVSLGPALAPVPDVVGLPQAAAETAIVAANLAVGTVSTANSGTVPAGDVIDQNPAAGATVSPGSAVDLVVSLGPVLVTVPDVAGLAQADAEAAIVAAGLTVGTVFTQNSDMVPAGNVIDQTPVAGTQLTLGGGVFLVVSLGPALAPVPDVVGLPQAAAEAAIVAANLVVGTVSTANSDIVPAGDVIGQTPLAGTLAAPGSAVDLLVSLGPESAPDPGDIDGDGDVDRDDIGLILAARNQPADGPDDPRDLDGDGTITVLDARRAVIMCTRPRCAVE